MTFDPSVLDVSDPTGCLGDDDKDENEDDLDDNRDIDELIAIYFDINPLKAKVKQILNYHFQRWLLCNSSDPLAIPSANFCF